MKITVLGAGAWGTALSIVLCENDHAVNLWSWQAQHAELMAQQRTNQQFLPGVALPPSLSISHDIEQALTEAELVVVVAPSHAVRSTMVAAAPWIAEQANVVCATKGIEEQSLLLMTEVILDVLAQHRSAWRGQVGVISGPSFAQEVARAVPTNVVAASTDSEFCLSLQRTFATGWLRVYSSPDPVGVEIGGALKNVIAVAAGASDGLGLGHNTRAALITRGIAEMARLVTRKGGEVLTTAGLAGMGDLVLTCTGDMSRNRTLGQLLGRGHCVKDALGSLSGVAEGYLTSKSAHHLALSLDVDLPICEAVYSVLHTGKAPKQALSALMSRPLRAEWE